MSSIEKRAVSGGFANMLSFLFAFIQSILLVPVFLNNWGKEKYGIWIAITAFFTLIKTFDLGHQTYIGNELIRYYKTNISKAKEILASGLRFAYFIGAAELLLGMGILYFFSPLFWDITRQQEIFKEAYYGTFALLLMWLSFGSVAGILSRVLLSTGHFARASYWAIIFKILETSVLLYAAFSKASIFLACLLLAVVSLLFSVVFIMDVKKQSPDLFPYKAFVKFRTGYQNFFRSIILTVSGMADQFGNNIQIAFVSSNMGKGTIPVLTTVKTITNIAIQVVAVFTGPVTVDMIQLYVQGDKNKMPEFFSVIWLITLLTIYLPFVLFTPFVESIYHVWTHNLLPFNKPLYSLLALSVCIIAFGTPFKLLLTGINHLRSITVIAVVRFVVLCTIPFGIKKLGLTMVGLSIVFSEVLASVIVPYFFLQRQLQIFSTAADKKTLVLSLLPLPVVGVFLLLMHNENFSPVITMPVSVLILLLIGLAHWNHLKKETRQRILLSFMSRFHRFSHSVNKQ